MLIRIGTIFKRYMNQLKLIACLAWVNMVFQSKNGQENQTLGFNIEVLSCVTEGQKSKN